MALKPAEIKKGKTYVEDLISSLSPTRVYRNSECSICNSHLVEVRLLDGSIQCKECYQKGKLK